MNWPQTAAEAPVLVNTARVYRVGVAILRTFPTRLPVFTTPFNVDDAKVHVYATGRETLEVGVVVERALKLSWYQSTPSSERSIAIPSTDDVDDAVNWTASVTESAAVGSLGDDWFVPFKLNESYTSVLVAVPGVIYAGDVVAVAVTAFGAKKDGFACAAVTPNASTSAKVKNAAPMIPKCRSIDVFIVSVINI